MVGKCSNYARNWELCFSLWNMLFQADYAKNYASIFGASLKRAPQLRVDLAFCHDIYINIYIYRPADLCLWSGARRQGRMLRAKSSRRNFVWERSSVLVHACSFTYVFEFVTDRTCQSLAFAFDCQHWTTVQKILGLLKNAIKSKKPGLSFASGPAGIETCFCFPIYLPIEKASSTKQRYYCNSLSCKLLPQLIDYSATKSFFLTDNWVTLVFHTPARC